MVRVGACGSRLAERVNIRVLLPRPAPARRRWRRRVSPHQALAASIHWSHDRLDNSERRTFRRLLVAGRLSGHRQTTIGSGCPVRHGCARWDTAGSVLRPIHRQWDSIEPSTISAATDAFDSVRANEGCARRARSTKSRTASDVATAFGLVRTRCVERRDRAQVTSAGTASGSRLVASTDTDVLAASTSATNAASRRSRARSCPGRGAPDVQRPRHLQRGTSLG